MNYYEEPAPVQQNTGGNQQAPILQSTGVNQQAPMYYQPPIPEGPNMTQPVQPAQPPVNSTLVITPSTSLDASFIPDSRTREILGMVHGELANAFVNIAIKKFSTDEDFLNYFVKEEFKTQAEKEVKATQSSPAKEETKSSAAVEFGSW